MTLISPYIFAWGHNNREHYQTCCLQDAIDLGLDNITLGFLTNERFDEILEWKEDILSNKDKINVTLSIGGATGTFPSTNLNEDVRKLNTLLDELQIDMIDLDIEGEILKDAKKVANWVKVINELNHKRNGKLWISLTLPVEYDGGLNSHAVHTIRLFQNARIPIKIVNLMLMDYFTPLEGFRTWGDLNINVLKCTYKMLRTLGFNWNQIGVCPMIGENDDGTKFTVDDWEKLLSFAKCNNVGLISFWAINRDQKSHLFKATNVDTHSKCQKCDHEYTMKAIELFK